MSALLRNCVECKTELTVSYRVVKDRMYCDKCSARLLKSCPACKDYTFFDKVCLSCKYCPIECSKCSKTINEGVWLLSKIYCKDCASPPKSRALPIPQWYAPNLYIPPNSLGCYRRDVCRGSCTCDSPN